MWGRECLFYLPNVCLTSQERERVHSARGDESPEPEQLLRLLCVALHSDQGPHSDTEPEPGTNYSNARGGERGDLHQRVTRLEM